MKPRSTALYILTAIAVMFVLQQAEEVLLPVVLAALISFALSPLVSRMSVWKVHRTLSAGVLLSIFVGLLVFSFYAFGDQLNEIVNRLPEGAQNLRKVVRENVRERGSFKKMQEAAKEATGQPPPSPTPPAGPAFNIQTYLLSGWLGVFGFITQAVITLFLSYFLLVSGDLFKRKIVKIAGSELADKKVTV